VFHVKQCAVAWCRALCRIVRSNCTRPLAESKSRRPRHRQIQREGRLSHANAPRPRLAENLVWNSQVFQSYPRPSVRLPPVPRRAGLHGARGRVGRCASGVSRSALTRSRRVNARERYKLRWPAHGLRPCRARPGQTAYWKRESVGQVDSCCGSRGRDQVDLVRPRLVSRETSRAPGPAQEETAPPRPNPANCALSTKPGNGFNGSRRDTL
jgi:hypothetical protein